MGAKISFYVTFGTEWNQLRKQCEALNLQHIYDRYMERLVVTKVAIFLFIIELLLGIHLIILTFVFTYPLLMLIPHIMIMILLPLILLICFKNRANYKHFRLWNNLASCAAVFLLAIRDTFCYIMLHTYNTSNSNYYDHLIIVSVYYFLPIAYYGIPCLLGFGVSLLYVIYCIILTLCKSEELVLANLGAYALYLLLLNVIMMGFHATMDYHLRQIILVRRQLLLQNYQLKRAMEEEELILETMLPSQSTPSLRNDIYKRVTIQDLAEPYLTPLKTHIELYAPVSILVAKISNYNELTTRLDVKDIVHILHMLAVNFEQAAKSNRVLVIKFLGDVYVCVAGMPKICRSHANSSVGYALAMISESQELSKFHGVDIKMRIGVHSGEVFSGIIGLAKWHYDIWSRDVDIAYRLEFTGVPGRVHISQTTRDFLEIEYPYEASSPLVKSDPVIRQANIKTYLVVPRASQFQRMDKLSSDISKPIELSTTSMSRSSLTAKDKTMEEIEKKLLTDLGEKVEHMAVGGLKLGQIFDFSKQSKGCTGDNLIRPYITSFWMNFRKSEDELSYMKEPDILMKYSLLMVVLICLPILVENLVPPTSDKVNTMLIIFAVLLILCTLSFYKKCVKQDTKRFFLSRWLLRLSQLLDGNFIVRTSVYIICIILSHFMVSLSAVECDMPKPSEVVTQKNYKFVEVSCCEFWKANDRVALVFSIIFLTGLPLLFKVILSTFLFVLYLLTVHAFYFPWRQSKTFNMNLPIVRGSFWYIFSLCLLFFILDHHVTFIKKVIFYYTLLYKKKLLLTEKSSRTTTIIMANILPSHALGWFSKRDTLFYESHDEVAIMFASIVDFEPGKTSIRVLHEYICLFDDLLAQYKTNFKVEKIKVAGWTYMAACGLEKDTPVNPSPKTVRKTTMFGTLITRRKAITNMDDMAPKKSIFQDHDTRVMTMTLFAVDMLRIVNDIAITNEFLSFGGSMRGKLQIGISHGPVVAGVVGKTRPHYDIWGHTVNTASLLTSTGVPGGVHVCENTAIVLRQSGIRCKSRESTDATENADENPTYLVALDRDLNFQLDDIKLDFKGDEGNTDKDEPEENNPAATFI